MYLAITRTWTCVSSQVGGQDIDSTGYGRCSFFNIAIRRSVITIFIVSGIELFVVELPAIADGVNS